MEKFLEISVPDHLNVFSPAFDAAAALQEKELPLPYPSMRVLDNISKCIVLVPGAAKVRAEEKRAHDSSHVHCSHLHLSVTLQLKLHQRCKRLELMCCGRSPNSRKYLQP
jgi:hypothetical protein